MPILLPKSYTMSLVALSVFVSIATSYVALDVGSRIATKGQWRRRWIWIALSAATLGGGIWVMHFVAMVALTLPVSVSYDVPYLIISVLVAVIASSVAMGLTVWMKDRSPPILLIAPALAMGVAIAGMHYLGMNAMRGPLAIEYDMRYVAASIVIAIVASWVALVLTTASTKGPSRYPERTGAAVLMGSAVAGMHYTGMHAAVFCAAPPPAPGLFAVPTPALAVIVALIALMVLGVNLAASTMDRRAERDEFERARTHDREMVLERERVARQEAELANRVKLDFLATMSHELRTPLNAIAGHTDLLLMGLHGPVSNAQRDALVRIQRSEQRLLGLINDVLSFAKIDAGTVRYTIKRVALAPIVLEAKLLLEPEMRAKQISYSELTELDGVVVLADEEKVGQIIINLFSNAVKFTKSGGSLSVSCTTTEKGVHLAVSDTGIGIPPDKLHNIFEPFVQVSPGLTRERDGTGLGLAISRDLAVGMGGELVAESELGVGSTFTLHLPSGVPLLEDEHAVDGEGTPPSLTSESGAPQHTPSRPRTVAVA